MASTDGYRASCVIWNPKDDDRNVTINLDEIGFPQGTYRVYRIDRDHASWGDNQANEALLPVSSEENRSTADLHWTGTIPAGGVVYLDVDSGESSPEFDRRPVARWLQAHHYFPDRSTTAYGHFDRIRWIAWLGTAREDDAHTQIGVTAEDFPEALTVSFEVDGQLQKRDENSLLGLRLDYRVDGAYTYGVLFHGPYDHEIDLYDESRSAPMPWGTKRQADEVIAVPDLQRFLVPVAKLAPDHWDGRAQLSLILQNVGRGNRVKVIIDRE